VAGRSSRAASRGGAAADFDYALRVSSWLSRSHWLSFHFAVVLLALAIYVFASLARRQRRHPSAAIGWVISLALVPYIALPLFLLVGVRKRVRAPRRAATRMPPPNGSPGSPAGRLQALAVGLGMDPPAAYRDLVVHADGEDALERLCTLLRDARSTIEVTIFLIGHDRIGARLCELLARRAREGIAVRLLLDGAGRYLGGVAPLHALRAAGVQVRLFGPPSSWLLFGGANLRNHRKYVIVDGDAAWAGGRNLAAEYFVPVASALHRSAPAWTDLTFELRGEVAAHARRQFEQDWAAAARTAPPEPATQAERATGDGGRLAQFLPCGPDQSDDTVYALLVDACFNARRRIVALTPYFVPDEVLLMALTLAARRGVAVELVVPRRSNHRLADLARPPALRELANAGAAVWMTPQMLHAKLVVVDDTVALAGSVNLDQRSLFLNFEAMFAFYDAHAIGRFAEWAAHVRSGAARFRGEPVGVGRELGEGLLRWLTFQL
jgi:cardiolipin synthase A/B